MITKKYNLAKIFFRFNLIVIAVVFVMGFRAGAFSSSNPKLTGLKGRSVILIGRVCEEADEGLSNRRLTLCVPDKILVTTSLYPAYQYGDYLRISGQLQAPPEIEKFDYAAYLARYDIYAVMYYPKLELQKGSLNIGQRIYKEMLAVKGKLKKIINSNLPEPGAGLANALLLGYRRTIMQAEADIFSRVGLSHMIAISGSHITIMSAMILSACLTLGLARRRARQVVYTFLIIYPLITGLAASAVRSAIMGGLAFIALGSGRLSSLWRALVFSAATMLAVNPRLLRDDLGFQLSFVALIGIIYLYPLAEKRAGKKIAGLKISFRIRRIIKIITDLTIMTVVAQLIVLPISLINFQQLSLIAPLANLLVLWTFPLLLGSLVVAVLISLAWPAGGLILFFPAHLLLEYIFFASLLLAKPSWAAISIDWFNWYHGLAYYLLLMIFFYILKPKSPFQKERA